MGTSRGVGVRGIVLDIITGRLGGIGDASGVGSLRGIFDQVGGLEEGPQALDGFTAETGIAADGFQEFLGGLFGGADGMGAFDVTADDHRQLEIKVLDAIAFDPSALEKFVQIEEGAIAGR
jgi:hypothetical protein